MDCFRMAGLAALVAVVYAVSLVVYRLFFHPLRRFPGPKLAAATYLVEIYYNMFHGEGGQFVWEYRKWHERYGPIIRLNPDEIHIQDSSYHEEFYKPSRPVEKPKYHRDRFSNPSSANSSVEHAFHRMRRGALNPSFSKQKVAEFAPQIQKLVEKVLNRLENEYKGTGRVANFSKMWGCFASDVVMVFCFDRPSEFLDTPDFHSDLNQAMSDMIESVHALTYIPYFAKLTQSLPEKLVKTLSPQIASVVDFTADLKSNIKGVMEAEARGEKTGDGIFRALLRSDLPPEEKTLPRLLDEGVSILGAGSEATGRVISVACFFILSDRRIFDKLTSELHAAIPDTSKMPTWAELEQLPYLSAVVHESLRWSYPGSRMPRAWPGGALQYGEWTIPPGTMVSMDNYAVSHDPTIFPDPFGFVPERWLGSPPPRAPDGKLLTRYMVAFARGTRSCTGMNVGWAEIYIALANFFRSPMAKTARVYDTVKERDILMSRDMFAAKPRKGSKGVQIIID
ncbi:putative P450 monooxygenase [Macrophomina phaseolina]|uniref:P450 monooxygenase n=1 Tax=Macrophomina phaseolina TaxID=35725 RepID=A0ABQ8GI30_9PEZI|nr:putative P450 monooxygenase [Macrophomina phaseolina]